ncbi:Hypothetical predicted protein, partial [Mytilus galloprovincialis]
MAPVVNFLHFLGVYQEHVVSPVYFSLRSAVLRDIQQRKRKAIANTYRFKQRRRNSTSNPDRPNIFLEIRRRLPNIRKVDKFDELIKPIVEQLYEQQSDFPLTVIYVENLESLVYYFRYLEYELEKM